MGLFDNLFDKCYICNSSFAKLHRIDMERFICEECFAKQERRGKRKPRTAYTPASDAICPHCRNKLAREPKAKTLCPSCKQPVFVLTVDGKNYAVTEDERRKFRRDKAKESRSIVKAIAEKYNNSIPPSEKDVLVCPYCFSRNVYVGKKGFGIGKAIVGGLIAGPLGLTGGLIGSNQIEIVCLKCGKKFTPFQ